MQGYSTVPSRNTTTNAGMIQRATVPIKRGNPHQPRHHKTGKYVCKGKKK